MSFSDDNLKRLKDSLNGTKFFFPWYDRMGDEKLKSLLARLDAGESALQSFRDDKEHRFTPEQVDKLIVWRRAAGKGE